MKGKENTNIFRGNSFLNEDDETPVSSSSSEKEIDNDEVSYDTEKEEREAFENNNNILTPELEEHIAKVGYQGLLRRPLAGSLVSKVKALTSKGDFKKRASDYMTNVLLEEVLVSWMGSDISLMVYIVFRLVMPHAIAYEYAENFSDPSATEADTFRTISEITDMDIKSRKDFQKIFKKMGVYHPFLIKVFKGMMSVTKSRG